MSDLTTLQPPLSKEEFCEKPLESGQAFDDKGIPLVEDNENSPIEAVRLGNWPSPPSSLRENTPH